MKHALDATAWAAGCRHLAAADPVLAGLIDAYGQERLAPHGDVFATLARAIAGQQISVLAAERIWQRLLDRLGRATPAAVLAAGEADLAACGLTRRKAAALSAIAAGLEAGAAIPDSREALLALPGVGPWTADMVAIFALGAPDVLPLADIGLHRAIAGHYGVPRENLDPEGLQRVAAPWRPWRSIAVWYLWRALDPVPVSYLAASGPVRGTFVPPGRSDLPQGPWDAQAQLWSRRNQARQTKAASAPATPARIGLIPSRASTWMLIQRVRLLLVRPVPARPWAISTPPHVANAMMAVAAVKERMRLPSPR